MRKNWPPVNGMPVIGRRTQDGNYYFKLLCRCGVTFYCSETSIREKTVKSCGCKTPVWKKRSKYVPPDQRPDAAERKAAWDAAFAAKRKA